MKKVLILTANPEGTPALRLDKELRDIEEGLRRAQHRDEFRITKQLAVRPRDIHRALLDNNPQIVHFSGHGAGEEGLVFEDESGRPKFVSGDALAGLFEVFANQIECVVLNGCYSKEQAKAISKHINYVVGMSQAISDKAAIEFAVGFYDALGAGKPFEVAYKLGCSAIELAGIQEKLTPILLQKSENNKNDNLFQKIQNRWQGRIAWRSTFLTSVGLTILMITLRLSGVLQASELFFFDYMMQTQQAEEPDNRLLIVQITQKDIEK
ncbi:MAG: CHAT domain-containing protein, partial [Scytonema sp. PMC 1069.18]|nr:CHAT domain-containing protein [Scytonema sp. PMC 1069.18]